MGEHEKVAEDRPYTHSGIQTLIQNTSRRNRAIILCMASSGPRVGAIPFVRIKDLEPIDKYNIYKIIYYPHSKKSRYFSYCTPECRKAIDDYLEYRKRWGEKLIEDSLLFRSDYNAEKVTNPKQITISTIEDFMNLLLLRCGLKPSIEGKKQRLDIMMTHGLRKFFETNAFKSSMVQSNTCRQNQNQN